MQLKKALLFLALISSAAVAVAQSAVPTITYVTNSPAPGDRFVYHAADTTGVTEGASGANVLWDYSLLLTQAMDTVTYYACWNTPACDSFPGATLAYTVGNNNMRFNYLSGNASRISNIGTFDTTGLTYTHFTDPEAIMFFPMSYGSHYRDTFCFSPLSGATDSFFCDGFGTLDLPGAVYPNALRVHRTTVYSDTDMTSGSPVISEYQTEEYNWFDSGYHTPLLTISIDTFQSTTSGMPYISGVVYYHVIPRLGTTTIGNNPAQFTLFPNPASDAVTLQFTAGSATSASVIVSDVTGRAVKTVNASLRSGKNNLEVPVNSLPSGTYTVQLRTAEGYAVKKLVIAR